MMKRISIGLVALSLSMGALAGCKKKDDETEVPGTKGPSALDPKQASAEAKKEFRALYAKYEAAKPLSGAKCESFAKQFKDIYDEYGKAMTVSWFNAGAVWEECGDTKKAEGVYEAIIAKEPKFDLAYNNLGVIYWNRKNETKALDYFKRAVKENPKTKAPRNNLAAAVRNKYSSEPKQDDFDDAERNLQTVLAVDSSNRLAYENLARLYYDRGRLKDKSYLLLADLVVTQATRVLKDEGIESADLYNIKGLLFMETDNQVDALKAFKKAADLEPNHADANMNIAMISIRFRDYTQAEQSLNIALKDSRQKKNVETYLGLGVAERGLRKYNEAEKAFKDAMEVSKDDPRPLYNLGILYQEHVAAIEQEKSTSGEFVKKPYETAKDYFNKFASKAGGEKAYAEKVQDAKTRVANIDQLFKDIEEMKKLEAEAKRLEEQQKKAEEEERKRLLELEAKAKAAAAASSGGGEEPKAEDKK